MKIFKFLKESAKNFSETQNGNFLRIMRLKIYYLISDCKKSVYTTTHKNRNITGRQIEMLRKTGREKNPKTAQPNPQAQSPKDRKIINKQKQKHTIDILSKSQTPTISNRDKEIDTH